MPAVLEKDGKPLSTQSLLNDFRRCPQKVQYSHVEKIRKRFLTAREKPMTRGTWVHALLEAHYLGGDWKETHADYSANFHNLYDHEKEALGDLPAECAALMRSYLWHYGANKDDPLHGWEILEVEKKLETTWPNGDLFQGKVDLLIRDEFGLWIVDHKTKDRMPDFSLRLKDIQSVGYVKAARDMGIPVMGFIWNYIWTKPPTKPKLVGIGEKGGPPRLSKSACITDYPTAVGALTEYQQQYPNIKHADYKDWLLELHGQRYQPGKVNVSPFFQRKMLQRDDDQIARQWKSMYRTHRRLHSYYDATSDPDYIERVTEISCSWCNFKNLCDAEVFGGNADVIRTTQYVESDPLEYYQDRKDKD